MCRMLSLPMSFIGVLHWVLYSNRFRRSFRIDLVKCCLFLTHYKASSISSDLVLQFQDQGLYVIAQGLDTLKNMASDMNEELDRQVPLMEEIDTKAGNILIDSRGGIKQGNFGVFAYLFDASDRQRMMNTFVGIPCWPTLDSRMLIGTTITK
ncbi:hypothetical protein ACS0TY_019203 [Phlomoides rotata]